MRKTRWSVVYDAFISYSHAADGQLAPAVQRCLHKLAKRWYRPRALRVFRDEVSLAANPDLWETIEDALERSRYFIYMASPEAAASPWVQREIAFWKEQREPDTFLIAVTAGEVDWDDDEGDFDWERTTALPRQLSKWFRGEPMWVSLSWARHETQLSPEHGRFRDVIASLAAPLHGIPKEELDSEDVRQHRLARRLRRGAIAALVLLTLSAVTLGAVARGQQQEAEAQARTALSRALAAEAEVILEDDPLQAARVALAGLAVEPTAQVRRSLMGIIARNRHTVAFARPAFDFDEANLSPPGSTRAVSEVALSADGELLAFGNPSDTEVSLWDVRARRRSAGLELRGVSSDFPPSVTGVEMSADGSTLVSYQEGEVQVWDVAKREVTRSIPYLADQPRFSLSSDGRTLAAIGSDPNQPGPRAGFRPDLTVWDLTTGASIPISAGSIAPIGTPAFTRDGRHLLVEDHVDGGSGRLTPLDLQARRWLEPLSIPSETFATATERPLLARLNDRGIELWDYEAQQAMASSRVPAGNPGAVAISADGTVVVVGTNTGAVYAFDVRRSTWELLTQHRAPVLDLAVSADGQLVASTSQDLDVTLSSPTVDHRMNVLAALDGQASAGVDLVAPSPDGQRVATYGVNGLVLTEVDEDSEPVVLSAQVSSGFADPAISWSPDGRHLAAVLDTTVSVWDAHDGRQVATFEVPDRGAGSGTRPFSAELWLLPDEPLMLVEQGGEAGVALVDYRAGEVIQTLEARQGFTVSADGQTVVVVELANIPAGTKLDVWRLRGSSYRMVADVDDGVYASAGIALSPDGTRLALAGGRRVVLRTVQGDRRMTIPVPLEDPGLGRVVFSSDGETLIAPAGGRVSLWDVDSGLALGSWEHPGVGPDYPSSSDGVTFHDAASGTVTRWVIGTDRWHVALCGMALGELDQAERDRYLAGIEAEPICQ